MKTMRCVNVFLIACVCAASAVAASAQDRPRLGVTTGYPATIGVLWHVSERTAVRPQFSFTATDSSSQSLVDATTNFSSLGTEISVLFFSPPHDGLRLYVAPRFGYTRTTGTSDISDSTSDSYAAGGMFGGHYALGQRFAVFGEAGVQYSHTSSAITSSLSPALRTASKSSSFGTRTAVGVVIYF